MSCLNDNSEVNPQWCGGKLGIPFPAPFTPLAKSLIPADGAFLTSQFPQPLICVNMLFVRSLLSNMSFDQGRAQTDDGDESTGEHVDSTINSSDLEKRCRRPGTHCPRST